MRIRASLLYLVITKSFSGLLSSYLIRVKTAQNSKTIDLLAKGMSKIECLLQKGISAEAVVIPAGVAVVKRFSNGSPSRRREGEALKIS